MTRSCFRSETLRIVAFERHPDGTCTLKFRSPKAAEGTELLVPHLNAVDWNTDQDYMVSLDPYPAQTEPGEN
jgi:hypothetical protein